MNPYELISQNGLRVDPVLLSRQADDLQTRAVAAQRRLSELTGGFVTNPRSKKQVNGWRTMNGLAELPSLAKDFLRASSMDQEIAEAIISARSLDKKFATLDSIGKFISQTDGFVHPEFVCGKTLRWYAANPNMQTMPQEVRQTIVPRVGGRVFFQVDFVTFELSILAKLTLDHQLVHAVEGDAHQFVADSLGVSRDEAKLISYAILYGITADQLGTKLTGHDGAGLIADWLKLFGGVKEWMKAQTVSAARDGFVTTIQGHRIDIHDPKDAPDSTQWERRAFNYPIQGSAAEIQTQALEIAVDMGLGPHMDMQMHDAVLFEIEPENEWELRNWIKVVEHDVGFRMKLDGPVDVWGYFKTGIPSEEDSD